nr:uncharacterized protein LOC109155288 [Ipomoea batatas]
MEFVSETLSEKTATEAAVRSPEDQDLLERSARKSKRGRTYLEAATSRSEEVLMQETPVAVTPESANWKTPDATPSQARDHGEAPSRMEDRYGSWMLVSRKPRKNNGRGNWPPGGQPRARQHAPPGEPDLMGGGQRSQSRFAALDGIDDGMMEQYQEPDHAAPPELQQPYANLPRIRTNYRGESRQHVQSRPEPHPDYEPQINFSKEAPPVRQGQLQRGKNKGKEISSKVVYHDRGNSPSPSLADFENTYKHDPPDSERRPPNLDDPPDIAMQEAESGFDPNGLLAAGRRRS